MNKLSPDEKKMLRLLMSKAGLSHKKLLPKEKVIKLKTKTIRRIESLLVTEGFVAVACKDGKTVYVYSRNGLRSLQKNANNARSHKGLPVLLQALVVRKEESVPEGVAEKG